MDPNDESHRWPAPRSHTPTSGDENPKEGESMLIGQSSELNQEITPTCSNNPLPEASNSSNTTSALIPQYAVQQGTSQAPGSISSLERGIVPCTGNS